MSNFLPIVGLCGERDETEEGEASQSIYGEKTPPEYRGFLIGPGCVTVDYVGGVCSDFVQCYLGYCGESCLVSVFVVGYVN